MARLLLASLMMKVAIPQWLDRVSPVFDSAAEVVLVEMDRGNCGDRRLVAVRGQAPVERARCLGRLGTEVLICCAISRPMEVALAAAGIRVISNTCGTIEDVLHAFMDGRLQDRAFAVPGTRDRKAACHTERRGHRGS